MTSLGVRFYMPLHVSVQTGTGQNRCLLLNCRESLFSGQSVIS
jgi:hypothetical protein